MQGRRAIFATIASLVFATAALAQMPTSPWKKGAPFPEPDEELYGVAVNGKLYVIGGWDEGKAPGSQLRVRPGHRQVDEESADAASAHHAALAAANGKIYVFGGFVVPKDVAVPVGGAWEPIDDSWEYDPATDSGSHCAPLPGKRGSAVAAEVGGKIYVIGGRDHGGKLQGSVLHVLRTVSGTQHQRRVRPRDEQVGAPHGQCRCRATTPTAPRSTARST